ncbi:MAG: hypothetical protein IPK19_02210 [Chloroflexi bacterium]|nr:hypothetical protein [Chloroflexota bacterium]
MGIGKQRDYTLTAEHFGELEQALPARQPFEATWNSTRAREAYGPKSENR